MRLATLALVAVLCTVPTCGGFPQTKADGTSVAESRVLPPLPSSAPTALGPIPIRRVPNLRCDTIPALGCFHRNSWVIEVRDSLPLIMAWSALYHELAHAAFQSSGVEFESRKDEDTIAEAIAKSRVLEMRAGWPR